MDAILLSAVSRHLERDLVGHTFLAGERVGHFDYLIRMDGSKFSRLRVSVGPPYPFLLRPEPAQRFHRQTPDAFISLLGRELSEACLIAIEVREGDRVLELTWNAEKGNLRTLMVELLGKSANLLLLDEHRSILGYAREMASSFRAPNIGDTYRTPIPRKGLEQVTWDPSRAGEYVDRFAGKGIERDRAAAAFLKALSPPLGEAVASVQGAPTDPEATLAEILTAVRENQLRPTLYTARPPEELLRAPGCTQEPPVLSPFPLVRSPLPVKTSFASPEEATRALVSLMEVQEEFQNLRHRLLTTLRREAQRLEKLAGKLESELEATARADEHQRFGDLILAGLGDLENLGDHLRVPDLYHPEGERLDIPADPKRSPAENAERHYLRARKLRRGAETIRTRLEHVRSRQPRVSIWRQQAEAAREIQALQALERELAGEGVDRARRQKRGEKPLLAAPAEMGVRKYKTAEGFMILVGKSSRDNDRLTFELAAPKDFWFHAADRSGAHVVVRNPTRLKELPMPVLLAASRLAAHFSRARGRGKVEVHYTIKKYVRKGRGFGPGMVTLRNHRTLLVEPGIPEGENE